MWLLGDRKECEKSCMHYLGSACKHGASWGSGVEDFAGTINGIHTYIYGTVYIYVFTLTVSE